MSAEIDEILKRAKEIERVIELTGSPSVWVLLKPVLREPRIGSRVKDFLLRNKIETIAQLLQADADHLIMRTPNFGYKCRKLVNDELQKIGLRIYVGSFNNG